MSVSVSEIILEHSDSLMSLAGVVGVAESIHDDQPCVLVLVIELTDELREQIPSEIGGYQVVVSESGEITAL